MRVQGCTEMTFLLLAFELACTCESIWPPIASLCSQVQFANLYGLAQTCLVRALRGDVH